MALNILLFSSVVTLVSTVLQLGLEFRRDVDELKSQLTQIRSSYSDSLAASLWATSRADLDLQLGGIMRLPDLQYVEVRTDQGQLVASAGLPRQNEVVGLDFSLYFRHRGKLLHIGEVRLVAHLDGVYHKLRDKVVVILITQTIKTFLVSLFILYLFQLLVGRHLRRIAAFSEAISAAHEAPELKLDRQRDEQSPPDELEQVASALNAMHKRLRQSLLEVQTLLAEAEASRAALREANEQMEDQVRDRTLHLQAANKELEAFSYSVSHDLRSPLRGIDGWSLALKEDYGDQLDATANQYLDRVRREAQRMGQLIDDMLAFSRLGRADLHRSNLDLSALAGTVAARLRECHPERRFDFRIDPSMRAEGDAKLLDIVLSNLFENAAKFSGQREVALIEFGSRIETGPDWSGPRTVYFVRDNGVGFDMAYADKLFGVFQRLHRVSEFPGTGIGLATVQRIVQRHGGRIWADARPDEGACFFFTLEWDGQ